MLRYPSSRIVPGLLILLASLLLSSRPGWGRIITVTPSGRIQTAIDTARASGDTILVDSGNYIERLVLADKTLTLAGADPNLPPVVRLPADSTAAVLDLSGSAAPDTTVVDGFIFRGGKGWLDIPSGDRFGGAVVVRNTARIRLRRVVADSSTADWGGGIAVVQGGGLAFESSTIDTCFAASGGGGLYLGTSESVNVDAVTVTRSECVSGDGGGILAAGSGPLTLSNLNLRSNRAARGAGVAVSTGAQLILRRTVVAWNRATVEGGGIHLSASADLDFLTIDSNTAPSGMGGGVLVAASTPSLRNSVVTRNQGGGITCGAGAALLDFNDVWGNSPANLSGCQPGNDDISADPRFIGGDPFDYHLTFRSPAIDAADPAEPVPLDGGSRADIGAFEFRAGPRFITLESNDPDLIYKDGDTIGFDIEWEADSTLTVSLDPDFSGLDSDSLATPTVSAIQTGNPERFRFAVVKTISIRNTVRDTSGIVVPVTATTSLGGSTTVQALSVTLDNTPPLVPVLPTLPKAATSATFVVSGIARDTDGTTPADSVSVRINDGHRAGARPGPSGAFSATVTLTDRSNPISAVALDRTGNVSPATQPQVVTFVPDFFIEAPKRFRPGDAFTIGSRSADMRVEIHIINLAGQLIRILDGGGSELVTLPWEGRNAREEAVDSGPYIARIAIDVAGEPRRIEHRALILVGR
jgi:hypothetical protein